MRRAVVVRFAVLALLCGACSDDGGGGSDAGTVDIGPQDGLSCTTASDCPGAKPPCVAAECTAAGVCVLVDRTDLLCEDGDPCTIGDVCAKGSCTAGTDFCECRDNKDCAGKGANLCLGPVICDKNKLPWRCETKPGLAVSCKASTNYCSGEACDPATGKCKVVPTREGAPCDDGDLCTQGERCKKGKCADAKAVCPCTADADCKDKDDDDVCNGVMFCDTTAWPRVCRINPGSVVTCKDDGAPCTDPACDKKTGKCSNKNVADGTPCQDGDDCTEGDGCKAGKCVKGGTDVCKCSKNADCVGQDDGNLCNGTMFCEVSSGKCKPNPASVVVCPTVGDTACLKNVCYPLVGVCQPTAQEKTKDVCTGKKGEEICTSELLPPGESKPAQACEDGDVCTKGDVCKLGACTGGKDVCVCATDKECAQQDDGNLCNGTMFCNKATKKCELDPSSVVTCQTVNDTACLKHVCEPKTGKCQGKPVNQGGPCDADGNNCTKDDSCAAGTCKAGTNVCECQSNADCKSQEDGSLCNGTLFCDLKTKSCTVNPNTVITCSTIGNTACKKRVCLSKTGQCVMTKINEGLPCDADKNDCTVGDSCKAGLCKAGVSVCECQSDGECAKLDDGNPCTGKHYCDKSGNKPACLINPATVVVCQANNDTTCRKNLCNAKDGKCKLTNTDDGVACDADGTPCTIGDSCIAGTCVAGTPICQCTKDIDCAVLEDGNPCNGKLFCDVSSKKPTCKVNPSSVIKCSASGNTACRKNLCDAKDGKCKKTNILEAQPCGAGTLCVGQKLCKAGVCKAGAPVDCDDKNPCTTDSCNVFKGGCQHATKNGVPCSDNSKCTASDTCVKGDCLGTLVACSDGNPCTTDLCSPKSGCAHFINTLPCSDDDACTNKDACIAGKCTGTKLKCTEDKVACTTTTCDVNKGCVHLPDSAKCSDGKPCTVDICDIGAGACVHSQSIGACDDANACSHNDTCIGDACVAGHSSKVTTYAGTAGKQGADNSTLESSTFQGPRDVVMLPGGGMILADGTSVRLLPVDVGKVSTFADVPATGLAMSAEGVLYMISQSKCSIWRKLPGQAATLFAGPGYCDGAATKDGIGIDARFDAPHSGAVGENGRLFVTDQVAHVVRAIITKGSYGKVTTLAGKAGVLGDEDGGSTQARFKGPTAITRYGKSELLVADSANRKIRRLQLKEISGSLWANVTTWAGTGQHGALNGPKALATFANIRGLARDVRGNVYVSEHPPGHIRRISGEGVVVHLAGSAKGGKSNGSGLGASFGKPSGMAISSKGVLYVADYANFLVRAVELPYVSCDDGNKCTANGCNPTNGKCKDAKIASGSVCDDGSACTLNTKCLLGNCTSGKPLNCDDGNSCTKDSCDAKKGCLNVPDTGSCTPIRRAFISSRVFTGKLGGLANAHHFCQAMAEAASLGGSWKAWLSIDGESPSTFFNKSGDPYRRMDGKTIANNFKDLIDGKLAVSLSLNELGKPPVGSKSSCGGGGKVFTATTHKGVTAKTSFSHEHCSDWGTASANNKFRTVGGNFLATDAKWTTSCYKERCAAYNSGHLYCFEQSKHWVKK